MLKGKKILIGITGSIAAYKTATLTRLLVKQGAEVKVIMTEAAAGFITPLTLSTLSKNPVLSSLSVEDNWNNHVALGRWADAFIIVPASANTIAKMAGGLCDNLLLAVYLSATCPVILAPAMDEDMWRHNATKNNLHILLSNGNYIIPVEEGELASGLVGEGRMAEPEHIVSYLEDFFSHSAKRLSGKKALVTAGPTYEPIDPVRFIGNHSSGKMGVAIAEALAEQGAEVELVLGPSAAAVEHSNIHVTHIVTAEEMYVACINKFVKCDIIIMAAAVADYKPSEVAEQKIKKEAGGLSFELERTRDILATIGQNKTDRQILAGFALETNDEKENALKKLHAKNLDLIILNSLQDEGAGFRHDTNKITIFDKKGHEKTYPLLHKKAVAREIVNKVSELINH